MKLDVDDAEKRGGGASCSPAMGREWISSHFHELGKWIGSRPKIVASVTVVIMLALAGGLGAATIEERLPKLWAESGGRLEREQDYNDAFDYSDRTFSSNVMILTARDGSPNDNMLTRERLSEYLDPKKIFDDIKIERTFRQGMSTFERTFKLNDLCYKVPITKSLIIEIIEASSTNETDLTPYADVLANQFQELIKGNAVHSHNWHRLLQRGRVRL